MSGVICSVLWCWWAEVGQSLASFRVCGSKKEKEKKKQLSLLLAFLSLMHAAICMYITDIEMHMVGRILNFQTTVYLFSCSFFHSAPHHLIPSVSKSWQNLSGAILSDIFFLFCLSYINKFIPLILLMPFLFFPASLISLILLLKYSFYCKVCPFFY